MSCKRRANFLAGDPRNRDQAANSVLIRCRFYYGRRDSWALVGLRAFSWLNCRQRKGSCRTPGLRKAEAGETPSERRPAADRGGECAFVKIIEFAADRHAMGEPRHLHIGLVQQVGDVVGGALAVDRGGERQDDFLDRRIVARLTSASIVRSSGPMPSSGDSVPPSTW